MAGFDLGFDLAPLTPRDFDFGLDLGFGGGSKQRQRADWRVPLPTDQAESLTRRALGAGATGLSYVAGTLDKPGQAVRGLLAGRGARSLVHLLPFSDTIGLTNEGDHVTGRDLTDQWGLTRKGDNSWGAWGTGLAADFLTDPLSYSTFGAKHALTPAGKALQKTGYLKGWSREAIMKGFDATESGLRAAGKTTEDIAHMVNQGQRMATPAMEAAAKKAGLDLAAGQALGGLGGFGLPFASPSLVVGTGKTAQKIATGLDRTGTFLKYRNPIGRTWNQLFDPAVNGAVDRITQQGWAKYGDPAMQAYKQDARAHAADMLQALDPLIQAGKHNERDITQAARTAAEGVPTIGIFDPALVNEVQSVAGKIGQRNEQIIKEAQAAGVPLEDAADKYAKYVHRQALDVNHQNLQMAQRAGLYPVVSGSSLRREDIFRDIPGGTERINDWFMRFAGSKNKRAIAKAVKKDLVGDLVAGGGTIDKKLGKAFDKKAKDLAERISGASERYSKEGLDFYTPDLARDQIQRGAQHARLMASAKAAIGTIGDVAQPLRNDGTMVAIPELLKRIGLRTFKADQAMGDPMKGALVEMYKALASKGAGKVDSFLTGKIKALRGQVGKWGVSNEHAEQILKAYNKWIAPEPVKGPLAFMDSLSNAFKALAYPIWIPAHVRNAATAATNNLRSGTGWQDYMTQLGIMTGRATPEQLAHYGLQNIDEARKAMFASSNIFGGHGVADDVANSAVDALTGSAQSGRFTPHAPGSDRLGPTGNVAADAANLIVKQGLLDSLGALGHTAKEIVTNPLSPSKWGEALAGNVGIKGVGGVAKDVLPAVKVGRVAGTNIEDFFRGAQWLAEVRQGASHVAAADAVNKLHFDYDRLTSFEKNVMRRLVPFYTYARKNLPLQIETALHTPAWTQAQLKPFSQPDQDKGYVPDYLQSGVAIPTGPEVDGKRQYISKLGLPVEEAFEWLHFSNGLPDIRSTALDYMGQLNPLIKGPLEQMFDTQFHTQRRLSDLHAPKAASAIGRLFGEDNPQLLSQFLANTPLTRFITSADKLLDERKDPLAKATNLLTGVRVTDVDVDKQRAIDARNALESILQGQPHLSKYTSFYVKPEEAAKLTPEEVTLMRLYSMMQQRAREYAKQQREKIGVRM